MAADNFGTATEQRNANTHGIDLLSSRELVESLIREQATATEAVVAAGPRLAAAVEATVQRLERGGRLVYTGAGTSGRLAEADAAELPPTFGFDRVALLRPKAGDGAARDDETEDDPEAGRRRAAALELAGDDVVLCVSASGRTPFVLGAFELAVSRRSLTIALTSNAGTPLATLADHTIELLVGAEPIAGSTRMKAGLAQKLALTTYSTAVMIRLGRTFDNLMVEVPPRLSKLRARRITIVAEACGLERAQAESLLRASGDDVKVAVVRELAGVDETEARAALGRGGGIRAAVDRLGARGD